MHHLYATGPVRNRNSAKIQSRPVVCKLLFKLLLFVGLSAANLAVYAQVCPQTFIEESRTTSAVSYTHLTLPTIYSV